MPQFDITSPDGKKYRVTGPDGSTGEQAMTRLQDELSTQKMRDNSVKFPYDKPGTEYGEVLPFSRDTETGKTSLAVPEMIRSPVRGAIEAGRDLMGEGKTPGSQESKTLSGDEMNALMVGGARAAPGAGSFGFPGAGRTATPTKAQVEAAHGAGYVLTPAMISDSPGVVPGVMAGWGGKIKLQQAASARNQSVSNRLANEALGLPEHAILNDAAFNQIRAKAGQAYLAISESVPQITPDREFIGDVASLGTQMSEAAAHFPEIMSNPTIEKLTKDLSSGQPFSPQAGLELVKELRFQGNSNLKAQGDPMKHGLGLAQRQAADAVDDLMDREIQRQVQQSVEGGRKVDQNLVERYRNARKLIAKSYDVQAVTNTGTGDVNAQGLAKLASRGRPLTDQLKTIADTAAAFPKAMQRPEAFGGVEQHSALDFFGSMFAASQGDPSAIAMISGRPLARGAVLSNNMQEGMMAPKTPSALSPAANAMSRPPVFEPSDDRDPQSGLKR
jgi:hypothetical protein